MSLLETAISRYQDRINRKILSEIEHLPDHAIELKSAMRYALLNGGKRIRPFLVYSIGEMLNADIEDLDPIAIAIECIHAYSLIHDDLPAMDDDDLRRGKPTCHIAFDEATAILAGDALQSLAFEVLAKAQLSIQCAATQVRLLVLLSNASGYHGMCGGQAMDLAATNSDISLSQLKALHNLKTGALIEVAIAMAIEVSSDVGPDEKQSLLDFGQNIGLAFQVQDDILDIEGDSNIIGKPQGSDLAQNKSTYPSIMGLARAKDFLQQLHKQALFALHALPYNTELMEAFTDFTVQRDH